MSFRRPNVFGPRPHDALQSLRSHYEYIQDFVTVPVAGSWTIVQDGTGTFALSATAGGWLSMATRVSGTADNDEQYAFLPKNLSFAAARPCYLGASLKLTEAATSAANIIFGASSTGSADTLVDNGGGPPSSYDGAVFFKVDGTLEWQTETSHTTTQQTSATAGAYVSGTTYELGLFWNGSDSVTFFIGGVPVAVHSTAGALPTAAMGVLMGIKNGSANVETLLVDWIYMQATRVDNGLAAIGLSDITAPPSSGASDS